MAELVTGSNIGNMLQTLLMCDDLTAGDEPSYQACKTIYLYHPLGAKMAEAPIRMAQSQRREISIPGAPQEFIIDAFEKEWKRLKADDIIRNTKAQSRVYGIASVAILIDDGDGNKADPTQPLDWKTLAGKRIAFNVFDPLNTAGSLVLNQNPNAFDFQKPQSIAVTGQPYHPSRTVVVMNEAPIYISYTSAAFGFSGRSVYQRALFPLKTFVQSMITDDMVMKKAGVLVAMIKQAGSIINQAMVAFTGMKRAILKEARGDNVISIGETDKIESLNLQNLDAPVEQARKHVLENIAAAADMPAKLLNSETFAEGFGEGTEDAKAVAAYIDRIRLDMADLYDFFDRIVQHRAWTPEFYKIVQAKFRDEYEGKSYTQAFYEWTNAFNAVWPNLLTEPDSEKLKGEEIKTKTVIAVAEVLLPKVDPDTAAKVVGWLADNINENKLLISSPLDIDMDAVSEWLLEAANKAEELASAGAGEQPGDDKEPREPHAISDALGEYYQLEAAE